MPISKTEMEAGLAAGRRLCQEEWSAQSEITAVNELVAEGKAVASKWEYHDNFQCERRYVTANAVLAKEAGHG